MYDGYRSHMSLQVLTTFELGGIFVFALPAHTSGSTQPPDISVFSHSSRKSTPEYGAFDLSIQTTCLTYLTYVAL